MKKEILIAYLKKRLWSYHRTSQKAKFNLTRIQAKAKAEVLDEIIKWAQEQEE
jgi:hypothetical protein